MGLSSEIVPLVDPMTLAFTPDFHAE